MGEGSSRSLSELGVGGSAALARVHPKLFPVCAASEGEVLAEGSREESKGSPTWPK